MTHNKDNPFLTSTGDFQSIQEFGNNATWEAQTSQPDLAKKVGGWNPFEDTVNFGAISEDLLFGRYQHGGVGNPNSGTGCKSNYEKMHTFLMHFQLLLNNATFWHSVHHSLSRERMLLENCTKDHQLS